MGGARCGSGDDAVAENPLDWTGLLATGAVEGLDGGTGAVGVASVMAVRVTVNVAVPVLPAASVALTVMTLAPTTRGTAGVLHPVVPNAAPLVLPLAHAT